EKSGLHVLDLRPAVQTKQHGPGGRVVPGVHPLPSVRLIFLPPSDNVTLRVNGESNSFRVFFFQAEDGIQAGHVTGVQTCALPIRLKRRFGPLDPPRRLDPIDELILTVLSQNTSDVNRDRAYRAMRERYPKWEALAQADPRELAAAIRSGGLANTKAPRILAILAEIREREGGSLDLEWMRTATARRVRE